MKRRITVSLRLSIEELAKGVDIFYKNNIVPTNLSSIIRLIYQSGLNEAEPASQEAKKYIRSLTIQKVSKKPALPKNTHDNLLEDYLISNVKDEDKETAKNILSYLKETQDVKGNLTSENDTIARVTAEMYYPIKKDHPDKELIEEIWVKFKEGE
jgi:hypothetical protein